jgi:lipopolysaccharide export system protein LptA
MFADDTQLFNKNDESVKKSLDFLTIYEKASGSKVNYEKTKGMYIGSAKNNRAKFKKIVWTKDNVKTLGIHHDYNIQNDEIWKTIRDKMKKCVHVWKSRNLTYTGKSLIVKNLLIFLLWLRN